MKRYTLITALCLIVNATPSLAQHTFIVDTWLNNDDASIGDGVCATMLGECTLRAAISEANATPNIGGPDEILFTDIPILQWFAMIEVIGNPLPSITEKVVIDGTTAAGAVILNGSQLSGPVVGIHLDVGSRGSTIRGLHIGYFENGILINSNGNKIENNYIGTLPDGTDYWNRVGIMVVGGDNNTIGGDDKGNVVGFNSVGVSIYDANQTMIRGNYLGTDETGQNLGNWYSGLTLYESSQVIVGGTEATHGNTVGFNGTSGIVILDSDNVTVRNNFIGTNSAGQEMGNSVHGIHIYSFLLPMQGNVIGGLSAWGNTIGFNESDGIYVNEVGNLKIRGNYIGTNREGGEIGNGGSGIWIEGNQNNVKVGYDVDSEIPLSVPLANTIAYNGAAGIVVGSSVLEQQQSVIRGNHIYENAGAGIDLADDGLTANDADDADTGPNTLLNHPDIIRADYNGGFEVVAVEYSVSSEDVNAAYPLTIDAYLADDAGSGEGKTFIGSETYATPGAAQFIDVDATSINWLSTDRIVLTATDADDNTSEFSPASDEIGGPGNPAASANLRDILQRDEEQPAAFVLSDAYPNPFNPQTTFTLSLPETGHIRVTVYDMLGRQVALLHEGELAAGLTHTFTFDASHLSSGTYLLRVDGAHFVETRRLLLLK